MVYIINYIDKNRLPDRSIHSVVVHSTYCPLNGSPFFFLFFLLDPSSCSTNTTPYQYCYNRACKTVGITLAWTLASIRIAFASSLQGGLMLARSGLAVMRQRNITLGGMIKHTNHHSQTEIDEYAAYGFAAVGFLFQLYFRLSPPFPMNFLLFPFHIAEWVLRYGVMKASSAM
jgi:hypothetical protein